MCVCVSERLTERALGPADNLTLSASPSSGSDLNGSSLGVAVVSWAIVHTPGKREHWINPCYSGETESFTGAVRGSGRCTQLRSGSQEEGVQWLGSLVEVRLGLQLWLCDFLGEPL